MVLTNAQAVEVADKLEEKMVKVDRKLGLVFGWAFICKQNGEDYFDLHGDCIPEDAGMEAALDFALNSGVGKVMHVGKARGRIAFIWPEMTDVSKAYGGDEPQQTGLKIAYWTDDEELLEKFEDGTLKGFSIGGAYGDTEELPDAD